jgi:hypothetical protein
VRISGYPPRPRSPSEATERRNRRKEEGRRLPFCGGRRGRRLRLGVDSGEPLHAKEPQRAQPRGTEEGKREEEGASFLWGEEEAAGVPPGCGFRGTLHAQGGPASCDREEEQEEGRGRKEGFLSVGGRRGTQASPRCGFSGNPSTPKEPQRSCDREEEQEEGEREEGRASFLWGKKRQQASPRCGFRGTLHGRGAPAKLQSERR